MEQQANSFDAITMQKIVKGMSHAILVAVLLGLLDYFLQLAGAIQSNNPIVLILLSWFTSTGYNTIKEFIKGV